MGTDQDCGQTRNESTISYRAMSEPVKLQHLCRIWQFEWSRPACTENSTLRIAENPIPTITGQIKAVFRKKSQTEITGCTY